MSDHDCCEQVGQHSLPSQAEFLQHGILTVSQIPEDRCSVCLMEYTLSDTIVKLLSCSKCYFHADCIKAWFRSTHQKRGTCPNDRTELFIPDRILPSISAPFLQQLISIFNDFDVFLRQCGGLTDSVEIVLAWHHVMSRRRLVAGNLPHERLQRLLSEIRASEDPSYDHLVLESTSMENIFNHCRARYIAAFKGLFDERVANLRFLMEQVIMKQKEKAKEQGRPFEDPLPFVEEQMSLFPDQLRDFEWHHGPEMCSSIAILEDVVSFWNGPVDDV